MFFARSLSKLSMFADAATPVDRLQALSDCQQMVVVEARETWAQHSQKAFDMYDLALICS